MTLINFINKATSFSHIKYNNIYILILILIILLYIIFIFINEFISSHKYGKKLDIFQQHCFLKCNSKNCNKTFETVRGRHYYLQDILDNNNLCAFNIWELSHILLHFYIGYYFNIYYSLLIGIPFEIYEHKVWGCASYFDIFYNLIGASIGISMR